MLASAIDYYCRDLAEEACQVSLTHGMKAEYAVDSKHEAHHLRGEISNAAPHFGQNFMEANPTCGVRVAPQLSQNFVIFISITLINEITGIIATSIHHISRWEDDKAVIVAEKIIKRMPTRTTYRGNHFLLNATFLLT
ncbi:hypothetical protein V5E97_00420 [Singulisphaera sp. Ch08]|uniref:Uncharacterized protein n=1 Tax=Singulisphaera sp. Ch08 TaxID=3120278 RepID=A0AAU7CHK2_9BACT